MSALFHHGRQRGIDSGFDKPCCCTLRARRARGRSSEPGFEFTTRKVFES